MASILSTEIFASGSSLLNLSNTLKEFSEFSFNKSSEPAKRAADSSLFLNSGSAACSMPKPTPTGPKYLFKPDMAVPIEPAAATVTPAIPVLALLSQFGTSARSFFNTPIAAPKPYCV